jgi:hypothetical protein
MCWAGTGKIRNACMFKAESLKEIGFVNSSYLGESSAWPL